jgi:hypothetical protein
MLDRNKLDFFFELGGNTHRAPSIDELRRKCRLEIENQSNLEWQPIIAIRRLTPFASQNRNFVGFVLDRFWIAQKPDGSWAKHRWDPEGGSLAPATDDLRREWAYSSTAFAKTFALYEYDDKNILRDERTFHIEYSDEAWAKLKLISEQIRVLANRLDELMMTREGVEQLKALTVTRLLAAPSES